MEINSNSDTYSLENISVPKSITKETKEKFDNLLKAALLDNRPSTPIKKSAKSKSKNKLAAKLETDATTTSLENLVKEDDVVEINEKMSEKENKEFILNKFFRNTNDEHQNEVTTFTRPPVPKPRKRKNKQHANKNDSQSSQATFYISSPKLNKFELNSNSSNISNKTYDILPKNKKKSSKIGDILIHSTPVKNCQSIPIISQVDIIEEHKSIVESVASGVKNVDIIQSQNESVSTKIESKTSKTVEDIAVGKGKSEHGNELGKDLLVKEFDFKKLLQIVIHKTDKLQLNSYVIHPVVKVHIVDISKGNYYLKSDKNRPVVFYYENNKLNYILPVITHSYNLQEKRTLIPVWEEGILFNEDYNYIIQESENIILFFEVLDFVSFSVVSDHFTEGNAKGWHKIAFAFLKLHGKKNELNLNKRMRLQLYHYPVSKKLSDPQQCPLWDIWQKKKLKNYPSTLHVTIQDVPSPKQSSDAPLRSTNPTQQEKCSTNYISAEHTSPTTEPVNETNSIPLQGHARTSIVDHETAKKEHLWSKIPREVTSLPNKYLAKLTSGNEGCSFIKFSNNGLYLACSICVNEIYMVLIYSVVSLEEVHRFPCHQGLIYNICWSSDDDIIVIASADNTISVWNFATLNFLQILPHPAFVYSCDINSNLIASGCYDTTVRLWKNINFSNGNPKYELFQELEHHRGYITSLYFNKQCSLLYSADSVGDIKEWTVGTDKEDWILQRNISLDDLKDTIINQILPLNKEKRMLIHSRDSILRIIDLKTLVVLEWLQGGLNRRNQTTCSISSCGNYIISGSENSVVNIWKTRNGKYIGCLTPYQNSSFIAIQNVQFHPKDNIIAVSHHGSNLPIMMFVFDKNYGSSELDIRIIHPEEILYKTKNNLKKKISEKKNQDKIVDYKSVINKLDRLIVVDLNKTS